MLQHVLHGPKNQSDRQKQVQVRQTGFFQWNFESIGDSFWFLLVPVTLILDLSGFSFLMNACVLSIYTIITLQFI